jgi:hypothetical protein
MKKVVSAIRSRRRRKKDAETHNALLPFVRAVANCPDVLFGVVLPLLEDDPQAASSLFATCRIMHEMGRVSSGSAASMLKERGRPSVMQRRPPTLSRLALGLSRCGDDKRVFGAAVSLYVAALAARNGETRPVNWSLVACKDAVRLLRHTLLRRQPDSYSYADVRTHDKHVRALDPPVVVKLSPLDVLTCAEKGVLYVRVARFHEPLSKLAKKVDDDDPSARRAKKPSRKRLALVQPEAWIMERCRKSIARATAKATKQRRYMQDPITWLNLDLLFVADSGCLYAYVRAHSDAARFVRA